MKAVLRTQHMGPGPHPDGSPQSVHGGDRSSWKGVGETRPVKAPARPDELDAENQAIYDKWLEKYPDADEFGSELFARGQNTPDGVFYHASREGLDPAEQIEIPANDIGAGLYVGADPHALLTFYGVLQGDDVTDVYAFKVDDDFSWLDLRDPTEISTYEQAAKEVARDAGYKGKDTLGYLARSLGYDGLVYFDPWTTGEERAIWNYAKVTQLGKVTNAESLIEL